MLDPRDVVISYTFNIGHWDMHTPMAEMPLGAFERLVLGMINEGNPPLEFGLRHPKAGIVAVCMNPPRERYGLLEDGSPRTEPWTHQDEARHGCAVMETFIRRWQAGEVIE